MELDFKDISKAHFIGIGGIGISAIARMMNLEGKHVSGSDRDESEVTAELEKLGISVAIGQKAENIDPKTDLVVYSVAVPDDNPELMRAKELGIPRITYPQALSILSKDKFTIAVSGTHGKTTTTAMIAKVMMDAGLDPTVIVGSFLKDHKSNFVAGKSKYLVVEACEYRRSFLNLHPSILVVTNIDDDHLDYYKDINDIASAFAELASQIKPDGFLVCNKEYPHIEAVLKRAKCTVEDYELFGDWNLKLKIPGRHNLENAAAVLAVADILGISRAAAKKSLEDFSGTWRRFEHRGTMKNGVEVYDDYGHHPTEVKATLEGAREFFGTKEITVVFQPHLYSRTKQHLHAFGLSFAAADHVIVAPIYPAREPFDPEISSEMVAEEACKAGVDAMALPSFTAIEERLKNALTDSNQVLITMGAGEANKIGDRLLE